MDWINERIEERKALIEQKNQIAEAVQPLFGSLCGEIKKHVAAYCDAVGIPQAILFGGTYEEILLTIPKPGMVASPGEYLRRITLKVVKGKQPTISAGSIALNISICDDGSVCLSHNDDALSLKEAAVLVLDPFLFPELPRVKIPDSGSPLLVLDKE